ncbi:MAG: ABC transporter permease [Thermodesulfobacteriota bacterium]
MVTGRLRAEVVSGLARNKLALASAVFILAVCLAALFAPWLAPYSFDQPDFNHTLEPPSRLHIMGTDHLGRDLFSRLIYGARVSMMVGFLSALIALAIGTMYGSISALVGGRLDNLLMRIVEVVYSLPDLLLIILISVVIGRGIWAIFIALGLVRWASIARLVRGQVLLIRELAYMEAADAMGVSWSGKFFRHVLPNILGLVLVVMTLAVPSAILAESTLSFLGLGLAPPFSSWGTLASDGWRAFRSFPHLIIFPSLAIFATILAFNFLGDGLRDILDPRFPARWQRKP